MNQQEIDNWTLTRLRQEVDLMKQAIDAYRRKVTKPHVAEKLINECRARIFNAATHLGDFFTAYEYASTAEDNKLVARLARALARGETDDCKCQNDVMQTPGSSVQVPRFFNWSRIYDQEKGQWLDIYKCSKCNFMTAHPNSVASHSARMLDVARGRRDKKSKEKDHEVLRKL